MNWLNELKSAAGEVFSVLGPGFKEVVYEEALAHELRLRGVVYERQRNFEILYKGYKVLEGRADLILNPLWAGTDEPEALVELKAVKQIVESHRRQAQVYMASLNIGQGAVLSFGDEVLVDEVAKPDKRLERKVAVPVSGNGVGLSVELLERCTVEVLQYFGQEFIYREGTKKLFSEAIGVELRLQGLSFARGSYPVLYKCHPVEEVAFDFVFDNRTVAQVSFYKNEQEVKELVQEFEGWVRRFGLNRGYLIAIPSGEEGRVEVKMV